MLDQQDIQAIGNLVDEKIKANNVTNNAILLSSVDEKIKANNKENNKEIVGMMGEMVEQMILPRIDSLEQRVGSLELTVANLPTKRDLVDKIADGVSDTVKMLEKRSLPTRQMDQLFKQTTADIFDQNNIGSSDQRSRLRQSIVPAT